MGNQPSYFSRNGGGSSSVSGQDTSRFPVESISWDDATEFCRRLSAREGKTYRLPTEAEWEYACRAGTTTPFHFGSILNGEQANVDGNYPYGTSEKGPYLQRTTRVGSYRANAFGLYDMSGNVREWCQDYYYPSFYRQSPIDNPLNSSGEGYRVLRGGSWVDRARGSRSAYRGGFTPTDRGLNVGVRVVCELR
jgi:formylglycine-generating enzyme required for sulfatase activity